ncbi:hypothetical protein EHS13_04220 [Paenibacillus psychroresistens]|uniref:Golvesin/Xly CBD-like domain-containing protein n=1 Tax=Paenibacillus psychroresistens TaxID=1778678 RepID=A0A6B8RE10_9BACL|nr:hypothetical protein [Paenibacillus psychroresistens]QGQ94167.1 hypothetical protein EHS13_04220 [Paenibacillus psychroresistens]
MDCKHTTAGYYGANYLTDNTAGVDTGKTAKWTPTITQAGSYQVYMRWPAFNNRPDAAPIKIKYNGGNSTDISKSVNQTINSNLWVLIGTYN